MGSLRMLYEHPCDMVFGYHRLLIGLRHGDNLEAQYLRCSISRSSEIVRLTINGIDELRHEQIDWTDRNNSQCY